MRLRRSLQVAVAAAVLVSPLAAFAQVLGSVTTDRVGQPAPALMMPMLVALAIALIGLGAYSLRARSGRAVAGFALVAGLSLLAGLSYANGSVVIQGADCNTRTTHTYPSSFAETLTSLCPNLIRIVAIDCNGAPGAVFGDPLPSCTVGQTLTNGEACSLPICL
ncbi:MAG: hypothetical protein ACHQ9S_26755 [Candidatus Binatia bacterium]